MKRVISIILCAVMLLCAIPFSVAAQGDETPSTVAFTGADLFDKSYLSTSNSDTYTVSKDGDNCTYLRNKNADSMKYGDWNFKFASYGTATALKEYKYVVVKGRSNTVDGCGLSFADSGNGSEDTQAMFKLNEWSVHTVKAIWQNTDLRCRVYVQNNAGFTISNMALCKTEADAQAYIKTLTESEDETPSTVAFTGADLVGKMTSSYWSFTSSTANDSAVSCADTKDSYTWSSVSFDLSSKGTDLSEYKYVLIKVKRTGTEWPSIAFGANTNAIDAAAAYVQADKNDTWRVGVFHDGDVTGNDFWNTETKSKLQAVFRNNNRKAGFDISDLVLCKTKQEANVYAGLLGLEVKVTQSNCNASYYAASASIEVTNIPSDCDKVKVFDGTKLVKEYDVEGATSLSIPYTDIGPHRSVTIAAESSKVAYVRAVQTKGQSVRIFATIDDLTPSTVGFEVKVTCNNAAKTFEKTDISNVYTSVLAAGAVVTAKELGGTYIFALVIADVPAGDAEVTVTTVTDSVNGSAKTFNIKISESNA